MCTAISYNDYFGEQLNIKSYTKRKSMNRFPLCDIKFAITSLFFMRLFYHKKELQASAYSSLSNRFKF